MNDVVAAIDLVVAAVASATILLLRDVAALAPSVPLRRAWRVLAVVLAGCVALLLVHAAIALHGMADANDLVGGAIFLLGVSFIYATVWLSRRTAHDLIRMEGMAQAAYVDALTGIGNRRRFGEVLDAAVADAERFGPAPSVVILDIDRFKCVNDTHGHDAGDAVIRAIAAAVSGEAGATDTVCRIGGEEFAVLTTAAPAFAAMLAERARAAVAATRIAASTDLTLSVTVSLGLATFAAGETGADLLRRADAALYVAKRAGRNQLKLAG